MIDPKSTQHKLWTLLDNIDTLSDGIKPISLEQYILYFKCVNKQVAKRHKILRSDGYDLFSLEETPKDIGQMLCAVTEQMHERLGTSGNTGWETMPVEELQAKLLQAALDKRYIDVANYAGMLACRKT